MPENLVEVKNAAIEKEAGARRPLIRAVHSLESFTEQELYQELRKSGEPDELDLDLQRSLRHYLKELEELGVLRYKHGSYTVR